MNGIEFIAIITFALLGSIGHCIGMCGGFIVTYTTAKIKPGQTRFAQSTYHMFYNLGRVVTYTVLGMLFGYFGSLWDISPLARAIMFAIAGVMMILMGLSFAGKLNFLTSIEYPITRQPWFKKIFTSQLASAKPSSFFALGLLNGLFPCGLVYTMLVTATTTQSALWGAIVMAIFGLFTIPALFSFAFVVGLFSQTRFRSLMIQFAAVTIIVFGGWTLMKAYMQFDYWKNTPVEQQIKDAQDMGKCGAGKCGAGKCGMGKCGAKSTEKQDVKPLKEEMMKCGAGKCGEGKCGS
ncbi:MAG: sulfite exporter TauE/SafE family protein [Campylobacterota bacterium]